MYHLPYIFWLVIKTYEEDDTTKWICNLKQRESFKELKLFCLKSMKIIKTSQREINHELIVLKES